ncbi:MAG: 4-hydroxy-3-methylbut-2-enyl diphosphate reductase [Bacteroidales bacterium]|jgi:4-hydroxy-3-methylbut-2-enyl diphosphate reductase|nr:4-hydroxy-3-methylbut-2-enyl diphosphate reductase [Bacteroidales bacterium]MDD4672048.1 4-hydroxy-3-methylbut-2-enyl diphosphate reductase [Bacteroidales bacterium]MDY0347611.1 4-hydroxy-3-methylbut-2-enyl diphosphate reductase [Tenuifilaceae bacterium]
MPKEPKIHVEIDNHSGFCFGVVNAISRAEEELAKNGRLYCLGQIVHNSEEEQRLQSLGLKVISHSDLDNLHGEKVLLRAHGEPPSTYKKAIEKGIALIDASCPVVLRLQTKVRLGWEAMSKIGGQVIIFGKKGHAEVVGLLGQTNGNAIVIESINKLTSIDFSKPTELFAQTTMSSDEYNAIASEIGQKLKVKSIPFKVHNSICGQVANRKKELMKFSRNHDVILFVSGKNSSNGKMLYRICKEINPKTYLVSTPSELKAYWFKNTKTVGICGATSTPLWLMEKVAIEVKKIG